MPNDSGLRSRTESRTQPEEPLVSLPALDEVVPNLAALLTGPQNPTLDALVWSPSVLPASVISYAIDREQGLTEVQTLLEQRASQLETGKFSKFDVFYAPQAPIPPVLWEYNCENCRFFERNGGGRNAAGACQLVGQEGDIFGGERIHPDAWCALWLPESGEEWFDWIQDRLEGKND